MRKKATGSRGLIKLPRGLAPQVGKLINSIFRAEEGIRPRMRQLLACSPFNGSDGGPCLQILIDRLLLRVESGSPEDCQKAVLALVEIGPVAIDFICGHYRRPSDESFQLELIYLLYQLGLQDRIAASLALGSLLVEPENPCLVLVAIQAMSALRTFWEARGQELEQLPGEESEPGGTCPGFAHDPACESENGVWVGTP